MRCRKPKPTALHKLHGTLNATRHAKRATEPEIAGDFLSDAPEWLTDQQKAGWRYTVEHAPRNILKKIDLTVQAIWVEAEDRHRTAATPPRPAIAASATRPAPHLAAGSPSAGSPPATPPATTRD
jgi:phage terminase small subunit